MSYLSDEASKRITNLAKGQQQGLEVLHHHAYRLKIGLRKTIDFACTRDIAMTLNDAWTPSFEVIIGIISTHKLFIGLLACVFNQEY